MISQPEPRYKEDNLTTNMYNATAHQIVLSPEAYLCQVVSIALLIPMIVRQHLSGYRTEKLLVETARDYTDLLAEHEAAEERTKNWVKNAEILRKKTAQATAAALEALKKKCYDDSRELVRRNAKLHNDSLKAHAVAEVLKRERNSLRDRTAELRAELAGSSAARRAWEPWSPEFLKDTHTREQMCNALQEAQAQLRGRAFELEELQEAAACEDGEYDAIAIEAADDEAHSLALARRLQREADEEGATGRRQARRSCVQSSETGGLRRSARIAANASMG